MYKVTKISAYHLPMKCIHVYRENVEQNIFKYHYGVKFMKNHFSDKLKQILKIQGVAKILMEFIFTSDPPVLLLTKGQLKSFSF